MSREHQSQVDELLADYRASRERLATTTRELAAISERVSSADKAITVTVGRTGELTGLDITAEAYHHYTPAQLGELIVRTTSVAAGRAAARAAELLRPALPSDVDPHSVLSGTGELRPEEVVTPQEKPAPAPPRQRRRSDDEESLENRSWLEDTFPRSHP